MLRVSVWSIAASLAACTTTVPTPTSLPPAPAPQAQELGVDRHASPEARALAAFEQRYRQQAAQAAAQGRWADAQVGWDVVLALRPHDEEAAARRREAVLAAEAGVAERLPRARQARQRGDVDGAMRLYLEILALDPLQKEAADALRAIEFERVRRSRSEVAAGEMASGKKPVEPARVPMAAAGVVRADVEHAAMLSRQGEIDGAIALLQPLATARRPDRAAIALLADVYVQQADRISATDPAAAIAALERSLKLVPGHPAATARLADLRKAAPPGARPNVRPKP